MRINAIDKEKMSRLAFDSLTEGFRFRADHVRLVILHCKSLIAVGMPDRAAQWHRWYSARAKEAGIELPPPGHDMRYFTGRTGPLKHGKYATPRTLAMAGGSRPPATASRTRLCGRSGRGGGGEPAPLV